MAKLSDITPEEKEEMLTEIVKNYEYGFIDGVQLILQVFEIPWTKFEKELIRKTFSAEISIQISRIRTSLDI